MNIFFTGCTHFNHANIIKLANRPFATVGEMDWEMIERWNKVVDRNDRVYHLGDFGYVNRTLAEHLLAQLNGQKILIHGNHDDSRVFHASGWFNTLLYHELEYAGRKLVLCHYPIEDWNGRWKGSIHLHCHTHAPQLRNPSIPNPANSALDLGNRLPAEVKCNRFNVGVDATAFAPISLEEIITESEK